MKAAGLRVTTPSALGFSTLLSKAAGLKVVNRLLLPVETQHNSIEHETFVIGTTYVPTYLRTVVLYRIHNTYV